VPAVVLAGLAKRIEAEVGVTISVGLSHNKFLAKISSELDKPRGFAVIGRAETLARLAPMPISAIIGVGRVFAERLKKDGLVTIGQLQEMQPNDLIRRYGETGARLSRLARGEDTRTVHSNEGMKSISTERTFFEDKIDFEELSTALLECCERLSERMKAKSLVGDTITLKLKTAGFRTRTRARSLTVPTQLAHTIYEVGSQLLAREIDGTAFRLIGVGMTGLEASGAEDPADLVEPAIARRSAAERAVDKLRGRYGREAVVRGKLFRKPKTEPQTPSKTPQDDVP
jgi:DNA polymerase-4